MQTGIDGRDPAEHVLPPIDGARRARIGPRVDSRAGCKRWTKVALSFGENRQRRKSKGGREGRNEFEKNVTFSPRLAYASIKVLFLGVAPRPQVIVLSAISGSKMPERPVERFTGRQGSETRCPAFGNKRKSVERTQRLLLQKSPTHRSLCDPSPVAGRQRFGRHEPRVHDLRAREPKHENADVLDADAPLALEEVVVSLQASDKQLLPDRDPPRGLFGNDGQTRDESGEGGMPPLGLAGSLRAGVVQSDRVEGPFADQG